MIESSVQTASQKLHSLLLPMNGFHLVLPQPTIAEIVPRPRVTQAPDAAPDWLIGTFAWRAEMVPLISFESMSGQAGGAARKNRYAAVLYALGDHPSLTYYALELKAIPHSALLAPANLLAAPALDSGNAAIAANVMIGSYRGVIPALEQIERLIRAHLSAAGVAG